MLKEGFDSILNALKKACLEVYGERLVSLCVFGSVAEGTMRSDSDIDVLLVAEPLPRGRMARVREFEAVDRVCGGVLDRARGAGIRTDFSPHIKTRAEVAQGSLLFLDMTRNVRILVDRGDFLAVYLEGLGERLAAMGAKRVNLKGGYYWILKPDLKPGEEIIL